MKTFRRALAALLLLCLLPSGAALAREDGGVVFYPFGAEITHASAFFYQITGLALTSDQSLRIDVQVEALEKDWVITKSSFVLMDLHDNAFYPDTFRIINRDEAFEDGYTLEAGLYTTLSFYVSFEETQPTELIWVCLDGADAYSCTRFAWLPGTQAAPSVPAGSAAEPAVSTAAAGFATSSGTSAVAVPAATDAEPIQCFPCHGSGTCNLCDGKGKLHIGTSAECTCPSCLGSGECVYCGGTGWVEPDRP